MFAQSREESAKLILLAALREARQHGATLEEIAAELGTSRQYVHKLLSR